MKIKLSGTRVQQIRIALGMAVPQFASVLAVHPGTVHRWEAAGPLLVSIDGVAAGVIAALDQRISASPSPPDASLNELGRQVVQALVVSGGLVALGLLIAELVGDARSIVHGARRR